MQSGSGYQSLDGTNNFAIDSSYCVSAMLCRKGSVKVAVIYIPTGMNYSQPSLEVVLVMEKGSLFHRTNP